MKVIKTSLALCLIWLLAACGNPMAMGLYGQLPYDASTYPSEDSFYSTENAAYSDGSTYGDEFGGDFGYTGEFPNPYLENGDYEYGLDPQTGLPYPHADPNLPQAEPSGLPYSATPDPEPAFGYPSLLRDQPPVNYAVRQELRVLTLNVWGLPGPLVKHRKARFERLGSTLENYDVVTLQETFSDDIEVLNATTDFPFHYRHNNKGLVRIGSGLYTLSRYPIVKTEFQAFGKCTVSDCLARKGVLLTRIEHPTIGMIDIYTTHYQAEAIPVAERVRIEEDNKVLQEMVESHNQGYPTLITGDFNFWPHQAEYQDLNGRLSITDVYAELHPDEPGYTSHPDNAYKSGTAPERLDYIFTLNQPGVEMTPLESKVEHDQPVEGFWLSDHYSVSARLKIEKTTP